MYKYFHTRARELLKAADKGTEALAPGAVASSLNPYILLSSESWMLGNPRDTESKPDQDAGLRSRRC